MPDNKYYSIIKFLCIKLNNPCQGHNNDKINYKEIKEDDCYKRIKCRLLFMQVSHKDVSQLLF